MKICLGMTVTNWHDYLSRTDPGCVNFWKPVHDLSEDGFIPRADCVEIQRLRRDRNADPAVRSTGVG